MKFQNIVDFGSHFLKGAKSAWMGFEPSVNGEIARVPFFLAIT